MANDILPQRERVSDKKIDLKPIRTELHPNLKGEFEKIYVKGPEKGLLVGKETYADRARAKLAAGKAAQIRENLLRDTRLDESVVDTLETEDQPILSPVVGEKKASKGVRGWWAKMFGGGE